MAVDSFLCDRIPVVKAQILLYEAAIDFLITNPTAEYTLDTGQSVQRVKRHDLDMLQNQMDTLYARLDSLNARCNGTGVIHMSMR